MQTMVPLYGFGGVPYSAVRKAAPRNLLDNSDFRNPVNQRGKTSYTGAGYTIDRWLTLGDSDIATIGDNGLSIVSGHIRQIIEKTAIETNNVYTCCALDTNGRLDVFSGRFSENEGTDMVWLGMYGESPCITMVGGHTYVWAALYEGTYTVETLPEYQPKGYGAELAECQRYYQIRSANNIAAVDMRPTMRLSSPTITSVTGGYAYSADL